MIKKLTIQTHTLSKNLIELSQRHFTFSHRTLQTNRFFPTSNPQHSTNHRNLTATRTPNIIVTNRPVRAKTTQPSRISLDHCHGRQQQNNTTTQINNHSPRGASQNRFRVSASKMCIDSCTERVLRMAVVYVVALTAETQRSR